MDNGLLHFLNRTIASPALDLGMVGLSWSLLLLPCLGLALLLTRHRRAGIAVLAGLAVSWSATMVVQFAVLRARPDSVRLVWPAPEFPSYPSGHAAMAFCTAIILALSFRRAWVAVAAFAAAALISLSRVYLGHHYPSDVLGGAVMGLGIGAACYGLIARSFQRGSTIGWLLWPQIALAFVASQMAYLDLLPPRLLSWPYADKVLHFVLFGLVTFWLNIWWRGKTIGPRGWHLALPFAIVLPFALASVEELLQSLSPLRSSGVDDLICDLLGMVFFYWLSRGKTSQVL